MDFNEISRKIKEVKIQGARNIAKAALKAYYLHPDKKHKKILLSLRPTEPMLQNVLKMADKTSKEKILEHFEEAQKEINPNVFKILNGKSKIFTHCHSTNVVNSLIYAKSRKRKFEVFNTETRPLYQGRKTAKALSEAGIKVMLITDLEAGEFIKKADAVFLGADALLKNGDIINKIGSATFAEIAFNHKVPVYIIADSWKFSSRKVRIEEREHQEVWKKAPKNLKIKNISFETVPSAYIKAIVSEFGILQPKEFVKKVKGKLPFS